jgi:3-dehydroquinate dehydratase-2
MAKIVILHGPNLNLLGKREPEIYGAQGFDNYLQNLREGFNNHELIYAQTNIEGALIDLLHEHGFSADGIILNAGAYTHTSVGIGDAVRAIETPVVEVHISNTYAREDYRHRSYIAPHAAGVIVGFGLKVYDLALNYFK